MATRKEINQINRRIEFLLHSDCVGSNDWKRHHTDACIAVMTGICWRDCLDAPFQPVDYRKKGHIRAYIQIMILAMEIKLSVSDITSRHLVIQKERSERRAEYRKTPETEGRDNKGVLVGGGYGGNRNKIRYPKLNKSKKVWVIFYKLFPWVAERDNWDGEKSDRFPRKKKK